MRIFHFIICLFVCLPLVMAEHTQAAQIVELADISEFDFRTLARTSPEQHQRATQKIQNKLERLIKRSGKKAETKEMFLARYEQKIMKAQQQQVKTVQKTLKPKKLAKLHQNLSAENSAITLEEVKLLLQDSIAADELNLKRSQMMGYLSNFEDEESFLQELKAELVSGRLSSNQDEGIARDIASDIITSILYSLLALVIVGAAVAGLWAAFTFFGVFTGTLLLIPGAILIFGTVVIAISIIRGDSWF